ncbi:MAG: HAD-IC family P-type ATPase, partial [bacterium]|nr:HAD-IC family P-type ATPase [bacterium]
KGVIRQLTAAETLGSTTLIMTDKTGTLTLAQMKLVGIYTTKNILDNHTEGEQKNLSIEHKSLLELAMLGADVSILNKDESEDKWSFVGRPFEVNIAKAAQMHKISLSGFLQSTPHIVLPFNSTNKFSVSKNEDMYVIMGAPDILLKNIDISGDDLAVLGEWISTTSNEGKRLVGLMSVPIKNNHDFKLEYLKEAEFLGMLVFYDPIRPEVPSAIKMIEEHGVKMVLVTGDLPGTAISIANTLGFDVLPGEVLTGMDLRVMSDDELATVINKIKIFARVTPEDKLRIGKVYQSLGEVVAMTGDGVNDAPALKAMDIGISLGTGSDVAKSAADLVLLDDNFQTISLAIDEGHRILANVRKTVVYLLSNSLDEVFVIGGALLFALPLPLTPLQIIWVNLFTGSLPALAFAYEENMDKKKFTKKESKVVFTPEVKVLTLGIGILSSILLFVLYYLLLQNMNNVGQAQSIFFVCFASYILVVAFSFRSLYKSIFSYNIFSNKKLNYSIIIATILLCLTIFTPFMRNIFDLASLPLFALPIVVLWLLINVMLVEFAKFILNKKDYIISFLFWSKKVNSTKS